MLAVLKVLDPPSVFVWKPSADDASMAIDRGVVQEVRNEYGVTFPNLNLRSMSVGLLVSLRVKLIVLMLKLI